MSVIDNLNERLAKQTTDVHTSLSRWNVLPFSIEIQRSQCVLNLKDVGQIAWPDKTSYTNRTGIAGFRLAFHWRAYSN